MEIFNIGIGEMLVILILMYVLLGPEGMLKAAHWLGKMTQQAYRFFNETWRSITDAPMDIRDLPRVLLDETGLKETYDELQKETRAARTELNRAVGDLNAPVIKPPADAKPLPAGKVEPEAPAVPENLAADAALVGPSPEPEELAIRPAPEAVAADLKLPGPAWSEEPQPEEAPKRRRGRPRKSEVRPPPPPEPAEPRKRGRPPKHRPEATAESGAEPPEAPVKEQPKPRTRLPRKAPSQPGDPIVPVDLGTDGGQMYATEPAPSTDEEHHNPHAA